MVVHGLFECCCSLIKRLWVYSEYNPYKSLIGKSVKANPG